MHVFALKEQSGKAFRMEAIAFRHDVTSACFHAKVMFTSRSSTVDRFILYAGRICHVHTLSQFMPRLAKCTTQPAALVGEPLEALS